MGNNTSTNYPASADEWEPHLPEPNAEGNYPAEVLRIDLAIDILRHRRRLGLSQAELARRAGVRPESLNRIELGRVARTSTATPANVWHAVMLAMDRTQKT
jgi:ribosome-binding protein aMBF1 (putative translation factor)